jgi:hypothetical protein
MAAEANRAVDEDAAAFRLQQRSYFVEQYRNVLHELDPEI